jgi:uncharacterized membrane protein
MYKDPALFRRIITVIVLSLFIPTIAAATSSIEEGTQQPQDLILTRSIPEYIERFQYFAIDNQIPFVSEGPFGTEVRMDGLETDQRSSYLRLPFSVETLDLPLGSRSVEVTLIDPEFIYINVPGTIGRNPHSIPKSEGGHPIIPEGGYLSPSEHITHRLMTGIDHETMESKGILSLHLSPVIPVGDHLRCLISGEIQISYESPKISSWGMAEEYDVLVICPESFIDVAFEYSEFRNATGRFTKVVTMTDILNDTYWDIQENDTQEEIKRFIYNARLNWGIDYVLLAGDQDHIPARHIYVLDGFDDSGAQYSDGAYVPSDLYYGDLFEDGTTTFTTWNENRAGNSVYLWGEFDGSSLDGPDLYPDVFIGRLPASTPGEFADMFDKIKGYELYAKGSDWYYNATLCGTNTFTYNPTPEGEYTCDYIESNYLDDYNVTKLYESSDTLYNISTVIDQGTGLLVFSDHGDYGGWGYTDSYPSGTYRSIHANGQDNGYMLLVAIFDACLTHGFDNENASDSVSGKDPVLNQWYYPPGSGLQGRDCIGEYMHKNPNGGAIATFGCTRVGYGSPGTTYPCVNSGYMNVRLNKAISEGVKTPGQVLATAQSDYLINLGVGGAASYKTVTEYILLGDPALNIGGITTTNVEIEMGDGNVTVPPGEEVTIDFTVSNIGIIPIDIILNASVIGNGRHVWSVNISIENATIPAERGITGTIDIYAPPMALVTQTREISLKVDSALLLKERKASITAFAMRTEGLNVTLDPPELSAPQGSSAVGFINIENHGNGMEAFDISFPDLLEGWTVNMTSFSIEVDAYKTAGFPFKLDLPDNYLAGEYDVTVTASSTITNATSTTILKMIVEPDRSFQLLLPLTSIEIYPEYNLSLPFNLAGSSNLAITIDMGWEGSRVEDWDIGMVNNGIDVAPFSNGSGDIWIHPPNGTDPGVYTLRIIADNGETIQEDHVDIIILRKYAFWVECEKPVIETSPGEDISFIVNVSNLGNIYAQFNVSVMGIPDDNWTAVLNPDLFSVAKASFKHFYLDISTLKPLNGTYPIKVLIEPWTGAGPQEIDLEVIIRKKFDFHLSGDFIEDRVNPGDALAGNFTLVNNANTIDSFTLEVAVDNGWIINSPDQEITINASGFVPLDINVSPPVDALAGEYSFRVMITSQGSDLNVMFTRTIFVSEKFDLRLEMELASDILDVRPGRVFQFIVKIENMGNTPDSVNIGVAASSYVSGWISLSTSMFTAIQPGENKTLEVIIDVPKNITEGDYRLSLMVRSMGEIDAVKENLTIRVEEKGNNGILSKVDIAPVAIAVVAGLGIVIVVGFILVRAYKKSSGVDIEDAGMEWEEDEEDEEDEDEDWEEDWE